MENILLAHCFLLSFKLLYINYRLKPSVVFRLKATRELLTFFYEMDRRSKHSPHQHQGENMENAVQHTVKTTELEIEDIIDAPQTVIEKSQDNNRTSMQSENVTTKKKRVRWSDLVDEEESDEEKEIADFKRVTEEHTPLGGLASKRFTSTSGNSICNTLGYSCSKCSSTNLLRSECVPVEENGRLFEHCWHCYEQRHNNGTQTSTTARKKILAKAVGFRKRSSEGLDNVSADGKRNTAFKFFMNNQAIITTEMVSAHEINEGGKQKRVFSAWFNILMKPEQYDCLLPSVSRARKMLAEEEVLTNFFRCLHLHLTVM